jgi:hypothetical protein
LFSEDGSDASLLTGQSLPDSRWSKEMLDANKAVIGLAAISRVTNRNSSRSHCSNLDDGLLVGTLHTGIVRLVVPEIVSMNAAFVVILVAVNNLQRRRIGKVYRFH